MDTVEGVEASQSTRASDPYEAEESAQAAFSDPSPADAPMADSPLDEARREAAVEAIAEPQDRHDKHRQDEPRHERGYESEQERQYESQHERMPEPPQPREERRDFQPAKPASVTEAIDEVNRVIADLKAVLNTMEEVLETLELAEVQKNADEREIQSLRNALRTMDRRGPEVREMRSGEPEQQPIPYQPQGRPQQQQRHDRRRHGRR